MIPVLFIDEVSFSVLITPFPLSLTFSTLSLPLTKFINMASSRPSTPPAKLASIAPTQHISSTPSNPAIISTLEKLCLSDTKDEMREDSNEKRGGTRRSSASQCIEVRDSIASTLQSLSPNEQQLPMADSDDHAYTDEKDTRSRFRPLSLLVKRSNTSSTSSSNQDEDQATFEDCFFDLLFSASLSVYGTAANLTSFYEVGQFMSYFSLLWWSWWCQTLYDVRYRSRHHAGIFTTVAHRATRIFLLGTWVAFSTCASEFSRGTYTNSTRSPAPHYSSTTSSAQSIPLLLAPTLSRSPIDPLASSVILSVLRLQLSRCYAGWPVDT
jgi:hypothetical protein